jgi:uridine kinase
MREFQEGVIIHIGGGNGEGLSKILQQLCENFWSNIEARAVKAFNSNSNV